MTSTILQGRGSQSCKSPAGVLIYHVLMFRSDKDTDAAHLKTIARFLNRDLGPYENIAQVIKTGLAIHRLGPLSPTDLKKAIKNHGRNT